MSMTKMQDIRPAEVGQGKVLVVDDDPTIVMFLRANLEERGYEVYVARSGTEALKQMARCAPQVILLDLALPEMSGFEVLGWLREWSESQVIVLSAHGGEQEKVRALDLGADDYVTKPFSMEELMARVRLAFRRLTRSNATAQANPPDSSHLIVAGDLQIDLAARLVERAGQSVKLTKTEFELLRVLAVNRDRVLTHRELLQQVWGPEYGEETEYLRSFMRNLRRKLERDPGQPQYLLTEAGVGYRFKS